MRGMDKSTDTPLYLSCPAVTLLAPSESGGLPSQFAGLAYSGDETPFWGRSVIDLSSTTIARAKTPTLMEHQRDKRVGMCSLSISDAGIQVANGALLSNEDAQRIAADAKDGFEFQFSIGLFGYSCEDVPPGVTITVNGRDFAGPIAVLRNGSIREVSFVALGADSNTHSRLFSQPQQSPRITPMDHAARIAELEAQNATTAAQLAATRTELETVKAEAAALAAKAEADAKAARDTQIKADFAALGWEWSEEKAKPYIGLSAESYGAIFGQIKASRPGLPAHLTQEQATHGKAPGTTEPVARLAMPDPLEIYAKRAEQARKGH